MSTWSNPYAALADGYGKLVNPNACEDPDEMFFKPKAGATPAEIDKCKALNYIFHVLLPNQARTVPEVVSTRHFEVFHVEEFQGLRMHVGVRIDSRKKMVAAILTGKDMKGESLEELKGWENGDTKVFVPRWNWLVSVLKDLTMDFDEHGARLKKEERDARAGFMYPDLTPDEAELKLAAFLKHEPEFQGDPHEEITHRFSVCAGVVGKVIGPKGASLQEIRLASGVKEIDMGNKDEDGERPKAREPKEIGVTGTREACMKAKVMIQKIEDEWKKAPRPARDGGGGMAAMPNGTGFGGGMQSMPAMPGGDFGGDYGGEQSATADDNAAAPIW